MEGTVEYKSLSLYTGTVDEIVEKKSRFIVTVVPVTNQEEIQDELEKLRKKYYDARHNCYAYVLGEKAEEIRCSDDGEPSGTAGKPILEVIQGSGITNILVVVTRYFGGTLLGTGGLVRAYTQAAQLGIQKSTIIEKEYGQYLDIRTDYNGLGKVQYILGEEQIQILESIYTDVVKVLAIVPVHKIKDISAKIVEATHGKSEQIMGDKTWFAIIDGKVEIFS